jgi:hypothetical protein
VTEKRIQSDEPSLKKRLRVLALLVPIIVLGIFPGQIIPRTHAATTGLICIAAITDVSAGKCPTSPPSFNGPLTAPNTVLRVPIMINNTDTFNGFDITVNSTADSSGKLVLKPFGVDLTGSIMPLNSIPLAGCVGSTTIFGSSGACAVNATIDNPTTVRAAVIFPTFLATGTAGLLFTALFSINGTSALGGVAINFQNHCDPYPSASANDHLCISISNGSIGSVSENVQTGHFDNSDTTTLPFVTLSTTTVNLGQSLVGGPAHALPKVTYTATSQNNFQLSSSPQLTLAVSFNGSGVRPTSALNMTLLDMTNLAAHPFNQTGNLPTNVPAGVYISTVTATYQTSDLITFTTDYLSAAYPLSFNVTDYSTSENPNPVTVPQPAGSKVVKVIVNSKASFNTLVKLGLTIPTATSSAGITASYSSSTVSGGSGYTNLTVTSSPTTPPGTYSITITSNSTLNGFTVFHTSTLSVKTGGFSISASTPPTLIVGNAANSTLTITYINGFTGTISLTNNTVTHLLCQPISPPSVTTNRTATISCLSTTSGLFALKINATSGAQIIPTTITFNFTQIFDVAIATTAIVTPSASATVGAKVTVNVQLQNKGTQSENVTVYLLADNLTITSQTLIIPTNSNQNVTFTWDTTSFTAKTYTLSVTVQLKSGEINKESGQQTLNSSVGSYTLNSSSSPSPDTTTIAIIAGIVVAIVVIVTLLVLRMRKKSTGGSQRGTM